MRTLMGIILVLLLSGGCAFASAQTQVKLIYQFEASHYVGLLNITYDFRGTEQVTVTRSSSSLLIDQVVSGTVRWPTTPGGFTAIPYSKWIEYLDSGGHVQLHIDVLQDDMTTGFSFHNTAIVDGNTVTDLGGDRVEEARVFINYAPREGFLFWSWINVLWSGQDYQLVIGKHSAGEIVSGWVPKWLVPARTYADPVALPLKLGSDVVVGGKAIPTLTSQAVYVASHPSKPGSEYLFAGYELTLTETLYWDRSSGLLVRQQLTGVSNNPVDTSQLSLTRALFSLSGMSLAEQVQTTTPMITTYSPVLTTTREVTPATAIQKTPQPGPPLLPIAILIVAGALATIFLIRQRSAPRRGRKR